MIQRILSHHYGQIETAERQSNDALLDIHTNVAGEELRRKSRQWREGKAAGSPATVQQLVDEVRSEILTQAPLCN